MGCSVVSVYNDEIIGKIGYPQIVMNDLSSRDFKPLSHLKNTKEVSSKIQTIYGFTQSFTRTHLFQTNIKNKEYFVYTAGRLIVLFQPQSSTKIIVTNPDEVMSFMVYEKLCVLGLNGGIVLLWDLQFLQVKLEILLPQLSSTISSVGISEKYIFVTDSSRPHNFIYVYDLRTGKLLTHNLINTFEPVLKSITVSQSLHITAAADGIWFIRMQGENKKVEVVKGMFKRFRKTSMLCMIKIENYILSGGVDGYVYVWKIKMAQCVKAIKFAQCQITAIGIKNKKVIVGSSDGRVKVYTFQILKKKETIKIQGQENEEPEEDLAFIMIDSYLQGGQVIALAGSKLSPQQYFCLTREGIFFKKSVPASSTQKKLVNPDLFKNSILEKLSSFGKMKLEHNIISSIDMQQNSININIYKVKEKEIQLLEERKLNLREPILAVIDYNYSTQEICFVSKENRVFIGKSKQKESQEIEEENILIDYNFRQQAIKIVSFVNYALKKLLCITTSRTILVLQRIGPKKYAELWQKKYQNKVPDSIKVDEIELYFQQVEQKWKTKNGQKKQINEEDMNKKIKTDFGVNQQKRYWLQEDRKISLGEGFVILWKE